MPSQEEDQSKSARTSFFIIMFLRLQDITIRCPIIMPSQEEDQSKSARTSFFIIMFLRLQDITIRCPIIKLSVKI